MIKDIEKFLHLIIEPFPMIVFDKNEMRINPMKISGVSFDANQ